jgi:hypothetical protein
MSSNTIYHYVYRITNIVEKKHYYGKRSSKCDPKQDLGVKYFSSSTDKEFRKDQQLNPQNYRYKIVQRFKDGKSAILRESKLHHKFNVSNSLKFYNKVKQNPNGYDLTDIEFSKEIRAKMSKSAKGRIVSSETKAKLKEKRKTRIFTKETCEKISNSLKGRIVSAETRAKFSKAYSGLKRSEETKAKFKANGTYKGKNNPMFKRYFKTPSGIFDSEIDIKKLKIAKFWCIHPDKIVGKFSYGRSEYLQSKFTRDFVQGKTFGELGFGFIPKEEYQFVSA